MAARKTTAVRKTDAEPKLSRFEQLRAEAKKELPVFEPYVLDETLDPPLVIEPPIGLDAQLTVLGMADKNGDTEIRNVKPMLHALCGKSFDRVWDLLKDEPIEVAEAVVQDMWKFFDEQVLDSAAETPGKE